jgi:ATP-dependent RNA helicase RhlE
LTFDDFDFDPDLLDGLDAMGFKSPTPIQQQAIPLILDNKDLIACAQTGTGKTAAYVLPILDKILVSGAYDINTLILSPTRELAQQIDQQIEALAYFIDVSSIAVYGGGDGAVWEQQKKAIKKGVDIVIATPGRLISHLTSGAFNFDKLKHLVLDEADRILDMGFYDDIVRIISYLPKERQTLLFSATMPPKIRTLANTILKNPEQISIAISKPAAGILQQAYMMHDKQKTGLVKKILKEGKYESVLMFASTKEAVKNIDITLRKAGIGVKAFHSDLEQNEREEILREFKNRRLSVIIGTDVLSRGIDVEGIDLVINYDVPPDPEDYIHRIGRTARASTTGTAITFITEKDQNKFARIEQLMGTEVTKLVMPEEFGPVPEYKPDAHKRSSGGKKRFSKGRKK